MIDSHPPGMMLGNSTPLPTLGNDYQCGVCLTTPWCRRQITLTEKDPNYPGDKRDSKILDSSSIDDEIFAAKEEEDSPYPEVRAAVHNYDEDVPCNTVRAWTLGLTLVFIGASMNTLFSLRAPSIGLGALVAQIIAWPLGRKLSGDISYTVHILNYSQPIHVVFL